MITAALAALDPGVRFNKDDMKMEVIAELVEAYEEEHSDKRTFGELMKIFNSLYSFVQLTIDTPSSHLAGMFPVLDLQMWVDKDNCLLYKFYSKPCSSRYVIPEKSAHSKRIKMCVLVEEGLRRMKNCSRRLDWEHRKGVMVEWARKLNRCGYPETYAIKS